jgi:hypothetical protein
VDKIENVDKYSAPHISILDVVVGLAWSYDPESYAGGSLATGSASYAG